MSKIGFTFAAEKNENIMSDTKEWFESWFDSPYHSLLYKHRDECEAKAFIDNLFQYLKPQPEAKVLDIACGDGRHAAYMKDYVAAVVGIDLSEQRINRAQTFANDKLSFYRQDMRNIFRLNYFDYAFNFFTSFGYFKHYRDNILAADAFAKSLKPGGTLVLDYMNVDLVKERLVAVEQVAVDGILFDIKRSSVEGKIVKTIDFTNEMEKSYSYQEVVSEFRQKDFEAMFANTGLQMKATFGDYDLSPFDDTSSSRLIMVFEKTVV